MTAGESAGHQTEKKVRAAARLRQRAEALNTKADRIEHSAERWSRGQSGEQTVGAQLELLRAHGYEVMHDVRWPGRQRANIDHVAVGPAGILIVDAKNWSGSVTVREGVVRQNGYRRTRQVEGVRQAAHDVGATLELPWALHVIPIIALADAAADAVHRAGDVTLVGHLALVSWVKSLPAQLEQHDVQQLSLKLRDSLPPATTAPTRIRPPSPRVSPPREPSARERRRTARRKSALRSTLIRLALLAVLVISLPTLLSLWGQHGPGIVKAALPLPTLTASVSPSATPPASFASCRALRATFPRGVQRPNAHNTGPTILRPAVTDRLVYRANAGLDRDHDGIVCEVRRDAKPSQS